LRTFFQYMDRNSIIGGVLLAILFVGYIFYTQNEQKQYAKYLEQRKADSIAYLAAHPHQLANAATATASAAAPDSAQLALQNSLPACYFGKGDTVVLENKKLSLKFCTKGAYPFAANLKDFLTYDKKPLYLFNGTNNRLHAVLPYDNGKATDELVFTPNLKNEANGDKTLDFRAELKDGKRVDIIYTLPADDFMMRCSILLTGMSSAAPLNLYWQTELLKTEKDLSIERTNTQFYYKLKNDDNDYYSIQSNEKSYKTDNATAWIGIRKQYFTTAIINEDGFSKFDSKYFYKTDEKNIAAYDFSRMECALKPGNEQSVNMKWYIGPNDFKVLQTYKLGMEDMVPLGFGIMAFVKYINKYALIHLFYLLTNFIGSYPLIILLMTIFLRLVTSFFTYKSYLSSAKMRVMKPELDELRAKCGDDQQKFSMESMKLYKSAGVNPMGGCVPSLIQMPILVSIFYLIPPLIEFRQKSLLWATDLSTYDSILDFPFKIPMYGDHVSLFTLTMTATSLLLALYNRNMTPKDPNNPMLQYMPYIFPFILIGMFNNSAAALTFYYTISNMLSLIQQVVIQKYFINEKEIHAQLQQNKSKPAEPSKWAQRLEEIQKQQLERSKVQPKINNKK
jgi:YidC/Oxa1 family membrane protein insertase